MTPGTQSLQERKSVLVFFAVARTLASSVRSFVGPRRGNGPNRTGLTVGYIIGVVMIAGGLVGVFFGIDAEGRSLEGVARPLLALPTRRPDRRFDQQVGLTPGSGILSASRSAAGDSAPPISDSIGRCTGPLEAMLGEVVRCVLFLHVVRVESIMVRWQARMDLTAVWGPTRCPSLREQLRPLDVF
jgi:hypothetical protein